MAMFTITSTSGSDGNLVCVLIIPYNFILLLTFVKHTLEIRLFE
jgi:hypothetical protein